MREAISFIHCADLHLDSPFKGLSHIPDHVFHDIRESTFNALDALVEAAITKKVDFVLMVGDLFDSDRQSLKAQIQLNKAFIKLKENDIQVYLSFGNHDFTSNQQFDFDFPENVHVFEEEQVNMATFMKNGQPLADIYGFSYKERAVKDNKTAEYQAVGNNRYNIAMLHGSLSSNTEHDLYAPFQISDLTVKPFDYWALGHIHKREVLKEAPPIVYPGNIQGRSRKESGEKGCYYVEMKDSASSLEFIPLHHVRFEEIQLDISKCSQPQQLEVLLNNVLTEIEESYGKSVVTVEFSSDNQLIKEWNQDGYLEEVVRYVNEVNSSKDNWIHIRGFTVRLKAVWELEELRNSRHFIGELVRNFDALEEMDTHLQPMLHHKQARKFFTPFTIEEQEQLKHEARAWLLSELLKE